MRVLFVSSGNKSGNISPIVQAQANSLCEFNDNIEIDFFPIIGNGVLGYINSIFPLYKQMAKIKYDVVHSHYSLSAFVATFAGAKNHVVSLMGSDVKSKKWFKYIIYLFYQFLWDVTIVKSADMKESLSFSKVKIIPNGVNLALFKPSRQKDEQVLLGWEPDKKHILFPSNPKRIEKNYRLLENAVKIINGDIEIHSLIDIPHDKTLHYYNAADVITLSSLWEGSPNSIKEGMACNRPIVSTEVGDVKFLLENVKGAYITTFNPTDYAKSISLALEDDVSNGRSKILELELSSKKVSQHLAKIYSKLRKV